MAENTAEQQTSQEETAASQPSNGGRMSRKTKGDSDPSRIFKRVRFYEKSDEQQPDEITLSVNGVVRQITRGEETILPKSFLECADNAFYMKTKKSKAASDRATMIRVQKYPYAIIDDATEKQYKAMLAAGNKARDEAQATQ